MKKIFLLLTILSVFKQHAISQHHYGLKAGLNLSDQNKTYGTRLSSTLYKQNIKPILRYQSGAFYKAALNAKWAISAEANFSVIGSKASFVTQEIISSGDSVTHYLTDKIGYIEFPVTLQYTYNKVYAGVGPGIAFKVFSKIKNFYGRTFNSTYFKNLDIAANLLTGYRISKKWDVNLRYSHGLLNIHEARNYVKTKNYYLNLSVLYFFK